MKRVILRIYGNFQYRTNSIAGEVSGILSLQKGLEQLGISNFLKID